MRSLEEKVSDLRVAVAKLDKRLDAMDARHTELGYRMTGAESAIRAALLGLTAKPAVKGFPWGEATKIGAGLVLALGVVLGKLFPEYAGLIERVLR